MFICVLFILFALPSTAVAQSSTLSADRETLTVGDPVLLTLSVPHTADQTAQPPEIVWEPFELLYDHPVETNSDGTTFGWTVTLWQPGTFEIPAMTVVVADQNGRSQTITSNPLPLTVVTVLSPDDLALRDIRAQATLPAPARGWLWLLLIGVAGTAVWQLRRSSPKPAAIAPLSAQQSALQALNQLESDQAAQPKTLADYATAVFDILRRFIQHTYHMPTESQTATDLDAALPDNPQAAALSPVLHQLDAVRFAPPAPQGDPKALSDAARAAIQQVETPS